MSPKRGRRSKAARWPAPLAAVGHREPLLVDELVDLMIAREKALGHEISPSSSGCVFRSTELTYVCVLSRLAEKRRK